MRNVRPDIWTGEMLAAPAAAGYVRIHVVVFGDSVMARDYTKVFFGLVGGRDSFGNLHGISFSMLSMRMRGERDD